MPSHLYYNCFIRMYCVSQVELEKQFFFSSQVVRNDKMVLPHATKRSVFIGGVISSSTSRWPFLHPFVSYIEVQPVPNM